MTCKRLIDVATSSLVLIAFALPMIAIALAIKLDSPGPVFFRQKRWGRDCREITVIKFRTMGFNQPDPHERYETLQHDPRITAVGRFLRKFSLDELPQLLNVIEGSMSIVGPRPLVEWESREALETHRERFVMPPGLTGLTQVSGRNGLSATERLDRDVEYVQRWSLWLDTTILLRTPLALLRVDGVYPEH